ncbi:MAG: hypothetical protein ACYDG4_04210 [Desulfuromonadaceae bacterium]
MICKALITGITHMKKDDTADSKGYDFQLVNFIDSEGGSGAVQSMSLPKDSAELAKLLPFFTESRMKVVPVIVYLSGKYINFAGFAK